jgi:UDPglucose 6-dehydrogenase
VSTTTKFTRMFIVSAELTKISLNSYITIKISYTGQLRLIAARHPQADMYTSLMLRAFSRVRV